jgi:hypothetical protein
MVKRSQLALRLLIACLFSIPLVWLVYKIGVNAPFQDELTFNNLYSEILSDGMLDLRELISSHNGHPLLIPKFLIGLTLRLGLPWVWLMYAQIALLSIAYLFAAARLGEIKNISDAVALFSLAFAIFSARQWENLYWAMQIAFPLYLALSFGAFFYVQRYASSRNVADLCVALLLAFCATTSHGAGIFTLILTCAAVLLIRHSARDIILSAVFVASGVAYFVCAQSASTSSGVGGGIPNFPELIHHAIQMLALTWFDFGKQKVTAEIFAIFFALVLVLAFARVLRSRPLYTFEFLSILIGLIVVLGVSFARVSAGIFQPDASRYVSLVIPISVGSILIFHKFNWRFLSIISLLILILSYSLSYSRELKLSAIRRHNMEEAKAALCTEGKVHPVHNIGSVVPLATIDNLRRLFCRAFVRIEHTNIEISGSQGFFQEDSQTWIAPRFLTQIPPSGVHVVVIRGWLPDVSGYPDDTFSLSVFANGERIGTSRLSAGGGFEVRAELPHGSSSLRIESTKRLKVGEDVRELSWVLETIEFL